jgi:RimJ/RimL family protein N-acetyltransferase
MRAERPAERLVGETVVLVRAGQDHLPGLQAAIETSHAELERWMDWAASEPQLIETTRTYLEARPEAWDNGEEFSFAMTDPVDGEVIGMCSLMSRPGPGRLEIGYWVRSDRAGAGVASAAAELLTDAGLDVSGTDIVEIHHDAANGASGRIPQKLGYTEVVRRDVEIDNPGEVGVEVIWEISRAERP